MRRALALIAAVATAATLAACGSEPSAPPRAEAEAPALRIGTKNFTEQFLLGELYRQALEAEGFRVELKRDVGSSELIHEALAGGGLDMYPEYVGVLLSEVAEVRDRPRSAEAAYRRARAFEERHGFTLLGMTPFSDANAIAVDPAVARRHGLRTIADLGRLPGRVRIAAPPEFRTRHEGLVGLRRRYGLRNVSVAPMRIGRQYGALRSGRVRAAAVFTTDGRLADGDLRLLEDPRGVFAAQHVAPVIDRGALRAHGPGLARVIDAVSEKLTTRAMRAMNAAVDLRGERPETVARRFLRGHGLV